LNLPPLTIEDLHEGEMAAQNTMTGEWSAQFNPEKSAEIQIKIQKQSKKGGINGSINTLSLSDLAGLTPEAELPTKTMANFQIVREAGIFVFEGNFNEGKGTGLWKLTPNKSFVADLRNLGYDNLPENYLFYAATENITAKFINDLEVAGYQLSFKELIQAASYKITPESIQVWRSEGFNNISFSELVKLGENDVTLEFINEIKAEGFPQISLSQAINLRAYEIDRNFIQQVRASDYPNVTIDALIDLRMRTSNK
jgi:hypothetical protein